MHVMDISLYVCVCVCLFGSSIEDWLRELVSYVGMCSPELSGCKVLSILLSKCFPDKVRIDICFVGKFLKCAACPRS